MPQNSKMLIGALVAAALAIAVYYGLIGQKEADSIQNRANQTLGTAPQSQQSTPPVPQNPTTPIPAPTSPAPQNSTQAPPQ